MVDERTVNLIEKIVARNAELIASVLARGDRVELIPVRDGVKVLRIERKEVR